MIVLIDGNNNICRDLLSPAADDGARMFRRRLIDIGEQWQPDRIVVAFDTRSFRHDLFDGYKAGRSDIDGLDRALDAAQHACIAEAVDEITVDGFEADDLIATFCCDAVALGEQVVIVSGDKDLHQLLQVDRVTQAVALRRDRGQLRGEWVTAAGLLERYGVHPYQWIDYRIMIGDKSDRIDGIAGIGPKTAQQILAACGSIDRFYASPFAAPITTDKRNKMLAGRDRIPLLRRLVTLRDDVPIPSEWVPA